MGRKQYTVLIFSQHAAKVKKLILSPLVLKAGGAALVLLLALSGYLFYDYVTYQKQVLDLKELRSELSSRQAEIQSFQEKISFLEEQLSRLKMVEEQVKRDLKEVQDLKKDKKVKKAISPPGPTPAPAKVSQATEALVPKHGALPFRGEQVSILEKERSRLVSRLHIDLLDLSSEAVYRERGLKELQGFLQAQKSVLQAIPSLWPVLGRITSGFGETRTSPSSGGTRPHLGIDIAAPPGTPIIAPADGTVIFAGREAEYGRLVTLEHGHGYTTMYGHLKEIKVKAGDRIKAGEVLGTVGTSGNTTGPHLHYEVRINNRPVNPFTYLTQKAS